MSTVKINNVQKQLVGIWLGISAIPFVTLVVQSLLGRFGDRTQEAWGWFLPTVSPTLVLVVGTVTHAAFRPADNKVVDRFFWRLAVWMSVFYVVLVTIVLIITSVSSSAIPAMMQSNLFLGPVQGLVGAALGVFFASATPPDPAAGAGDVLKPAAPEPE